MTPEEMLTAIRTEFDAWKAQVLRLAQRQGTATIVQTVANKVGGYSYDDILAAFAAELANHVNQHNPHQMSLANLGGIEKGEFDTLSNNYYPRLGFPFTKVLAVTYTTGASQLNIDGFDMLYMGELIHIDGKSLTTITGANQFLKVVVSGSPNNWSGVLTLGDVTEDIRTIVIGATADIRTAVSFTPIPILRVGHAAVSQTPRGLAIPATTGTPTSPASLDAGWFS